MASVSPNSGFQDSPVKLNKPQKAEEDFEDDEIFVPAGKVIEERKFLTCRYMLVLIFGSASIVLSVLGFISYTQHTNEDSAGNGLIEFNKLKGTFK